MKFIKRNKAYILISVMSSVAIESFALLICSSITGSLNTELLLHNMIVFSSSLWFRLAIIAGLGIMTFGVIKGIKSETLEKWMDSVSKRLEIRLDKRNHNAIYEALGIPLYDVLSAHSGEFGVSVTSFKSILTNGDYFRVKNGEWHYKYEVVAPSVPKFYNADLRGIIQAYIYQEIQLGMWGLNAFYNDEYSVYVTKAFYDKASHKMVIELFYVDSDKAYQYLKELKAHTEYHGAHEKENRQLLLSMSRKGIL